MAGQMKWLEIIELRTIGSRRKDIVTELRKLLDDLRKELSEDGVSAFSRVLFDGDFSIHLLHDSTVVAEDGSPLGLQLAASLSEFGLVNHSIWLEISP